MCKTNEPSSSPLPHPTTTLPLPTSSPSLTIDVNQIIPVAVAAAAQAMMITTILCIDGGGVRGIIPAIILAFLESQLKALDGEESRISDYFDVIGGTSTGGLMAAMLAAPNGNHRPLYAAEDIPQFYIDHSPRIFPKPCAGWLCFLDCFRLIKGPKYDGQNLRKIVKEVLGDTRISQTLTDVVIPTYDIKLGKSTIRAGPEIWPALSTIFTTSEAKMEVSMNALLSNVCISTSAAPTYFPAHCFTTHKSNGKLVEFNLIDGGVAANNPTLISMIHSGISIREEARKFLVISLGTGIPKLRGFTAGETTDWGIVDWFKKKGSNPLIDAFMKASVEMVDISVCALFGSHQLEDNFLRIQDDTLIGDASSLDVATEENLRNLVKIGETLLKKPVSFWNGETRVKLKDDETNEQALTRFAKLLSNERRRRLKAKDVNIAQCSRFPTPPNLIEMGLGSTNL